MRWLTGQTNEGGAMRAARWHARGDVRVDDVPRPVPTPEEALLRVLWCGICGTDLEELREGPISIPLTPHPTRGTSAPIVLGHEVVAIVEEAAADGSGPPAGTTVVPDVVVGCGRCWWCRRHEEGLCANLAVRGQTEDGGLAEFMVATAASLLTVPAGVDADAAALVEPASVAVRALRKVPQVAGARLLVIGAGTIGQLVVRVALALGASSVVVVDPRADRRALAAGFGAAGVDSTAKLGPLLPEDTGGFDAVVESSGAPGGVESALHAVRRGGTVVALGIRPGTEALTVTELVLGERRVVGSAAHLWDEDSRLALDLIATGRLPVADLVTHRVPLDRVVLDGFGALASGTGALKVLVDCR